MGELFREDENLYGIVFADSVRYITPYYLDGTLYTDFIDGEEVIEVFHMQEHYES